MRFHILKSLHDSLIINTTSYISFNIHNQIIFTECKINYKAKFNFINKKKTENVLKLFLKGK